METIIAAPLLLLFLCWVIYFHHNVPYGAGRVKKRLDTAKDAASRDYLTIWRF